MRRRVVFTRLLLTAVALGLLVGIVVAATNTGTGSSVNDYGAVPPQSLTNMSVTGAGDVELAGATVIDDFEDGDLAGWSFYGAETGDWVATSSQAHNGAYSVYKPTGSTASIEYGTLTSYDSSDGVMNASLWTRPASGAVGFITFGFQDVNNLYTVGAQADASGGAGGDLRIQKVSGGSTSILQVNAQNGVLPGGNWYKVEVEWGPSGSIDAWVDDDADARTNPILTASATDTEFSAGEVGFATYDTSDVYLDDFLVETVFNSGSLQGPLHTVTNSTGGWLNFTVTNVSVNASVHNNATGGVLNNWTWTTGGNKSLTWSSGASVDAVYFNISVQNTSDSGVSWTLHDEGVEFLNHDPTVSLSSPSDGATLATNTPALNFSITDPEFNEPQGDTATYRVFIDGAEVTSGSVTSSGAVSYTTDPLNGGSHTWHVNVSDDYGGSASSTTWSFSTPSKLYIRNELNASKLINQANYGANLSVDVKFYGTDTQVARTVTNGVVNLTGLPTTNFIVATTTDGWHDRRIYIDDLTTQSNIFLLNKTDATAVQPTFLLNDLSGAFPAKNSLLYVEKSIELNGTSKYRTLAGDYFGATNRFTVPLQYNTRHRLRLQGPTSTRVLGTFYPSATQEERLDVGEITGNYSTDKGYGSWFNATNTSGPGGVARWIYNDSAEATTNLHLVIHEKSNRSNELHNQTHAGPYGDLSVTEPLTDAELKKKWVATWTATRKGETIQSTTTAGTEQPGIADKWPMPTPFDAVMGFGILFIAAGLFSATNVGTGGIVVAAMGAIMAWIGLIEIAAPFIVVAFFVAIMHRISQGPEDR